MLDFVDPPAALDPAWEGFARGRPEAPRWLSRVDLDDEHGRVVGCYVTDAATALGLRPWDDAAEGRQGQAAWVLFDVEKLVRMALHQSGLAFEALCSAATWGDFPARAIADAAVTVNVLDYYRDVTAPLLHGRAERWRYRTLLTGVLLAEQGIVSHDLSTLAGRLALEPGVDLSAAPALHERLRSSSLPTRPSGYDFLNDFVVQARLGAS